MKENLKNSLKSELAERIEKNCGLRYLSRSQNVHKFREVIEDLYYFRPEQWMFWIDNYYNKLVSKSA